MKTVERPLIVDHEVAELLSAQPDLFAIADAVSATQSVRRRRVRGSVVAAIAAALGAIGLAVALVGPSGPGDAAIVGRALAAVGEGRILHVVARIGPQDEAIDLRTGQTIHPYQVVEEWYEPGVGLRARIIESNAYRSKPLPSLREVPSNYVQALNGFTSRYRQALDSGRATVDRRGSLLGKRVIWLRFKAASRSVGGIEIRSEPTYEVAIDASNYRPLYLQQLDSGGRPVATTEMYLLSVQQVTSVPRSAPPAPLPSGMHTMAGIDNVGPLTPGQAATFMTQPGLWLGSEFAGLPLVRIQGQRYSYGQAERFSDIKRHWHGIQLIYGSVNQYGRPVDRKPWVELDEQTDPVNGPGNPPLSGTLVLYDRFAGEVQLNGVYVRISVGAASGSDPEALLSAARSLKPIPAGQ
jgi:hypothetical protein